MLIVDEATSRSLLDVNEAIPALEDSFRAISEGPTVGFRGDIEDPARNTRGLLLGSYAARLGGVCFKLVGNWHGKRAGLILVFDASTGEADALVSAAHITDVRTGAATGAATRELARTNSRSLAILGTGRQAFTQLQAVLAVRPIEQVTVWNRTRANAEAWVERVNGSLGPSAPEFLLASTPEDAVRRADVVVTCTRSTEPVLRGNWLRPGVHVNAVGAGSALHRELEVDVLLRAGVKAVDSRELALRTGDFLEPMAAGKVREEEVAELGELLLGKRDGRTREEQITLFKSCGHAVNDLAVARLVARKAREAGLGIEVKV